MFIDKIILKSKENKNIYNQVGLIKFSFLDSDYTIKNNFGKLQVLVNEDHLFVSPSDSISACITTKKAIIADNIKTKEIFHIKKITMEEEKSIRNADILSDSILIVIDNVEYVLSVFLNKINICSEEEDNFTFSSVSSNVGEFKAF